MSSNSLYSNSSHSRCRVLRGSFSCTGIDTLDKSFPILLRRMFHKLILLVFGHGAGRHVRCFANPSTTEAPSTTEETNEYVLTISVMYNNFQRFLINKILYIQKIYISRSHQFLDTGCEKEEESDERSVRYASQYYLYSSTQGSLLCIHVWNNISSLAHTAHFPLSMPLIISVLHHIQLISVYPDHSSIHTPEHTAPITICIPPGISIFQHTQLTSLVSMHPISVQGRCNH